jgi:hypothetical protein
MADDCER